MIEAESKIQAPFTAEQVEGLNQYQKSRAMHPFTCVNRGDGAHPHESEYGEHGVLRATPKGWTCPRCNYTQNWAWEWMSVPETFANLFQQ